MADEEQVRGAAMAAIAEIDSKVQPQEPDKEPAEAPPQMHDAALKNCPCCSWDLSNRNLPVPAEDDKRQYVRSVMSKQQFAKTYSLFDGDVTVKYRLLRANQSKHLQKALRTIPESDNFILRSTQALRIKLLFYLVQFNEDTFEPLEPVAGEATDTYEYWENAYEDRFGEYSEDVPILFTRVLMEFTRLAEMLPSAGLDENFWKGAGLA